MITDFHTHIYPDKIAEKTISILKKQAPVVQNFSDGTISGLRKSMRQSGIGKAVILPVATRKGQFDTINRFAAEINSSCDDLISFGGIHPDDDDPEEKLALLDQQTVLYKEIASQNQPYRIQDLKVNGKDLMEIGIPEGPMVGQVLQALLEAVIEEEIPNQKSVLLEKARSMK